MKQQNSKIKKKTFTNLISKIIFPFSQTVGQSFHKYEGSYAIQQSQTLKQSNNLSEISKIKRTKGHKPSFNELTKLIYQFQKCDKKQYRNEMNPFTTLYAKNSPHSKYQFQSQKKYRSLTKSRSLTVNNRYTTNPAINENDSTEGQTNPFASNKMLKYKQRSLTKLQSNWMKDREKEKGKQIIKVHQFDQQKIDRNYDHLGKLRKKTTYNQQEIKSRFVSFKDLSKQISQIDKQTFQNARKDFNKKFKTYVGPKQQVEFNQFIQKQQGLQGNQEKGKVPSPKAAKKNFLKINPLYNMYRKDNNKGLRKKGDKKNYRISADENLLKAKFQLGSQQLVENDGDKDQFYSEVDQFGQANSNQEANNNRVMRKQVNEFDSHVFSSQELTNLRPRESQNEQTSIYDKVYFFSVKFSPGFASLFTIENVNLKSRSDGNLLIEIVISAYQEILVHRIKYNKHKWFETMNQLKPKIDDKNHEKDKLKNALFAELMANREEKKNRELLPVSVQLNSQKSNLQPGRRFPHSDVRNFSRNSIDRQIDKNNLLSHQYLPYEALSFMNFTKISTLSYELIIEYLQKFCRLQVSYLGSSLKETDPQFFLQKNTSFITKKHSNVELTFLESMNLARVFYFLVKINATYYVAKSVIIGGKKIKHYLLYEFSNMIRHEGGCVIEEEEGEMGESFTSMRDNEMVKWLFAKLNRFFTLTALKKWKQRKSIKINKNLLNNQYDYYFNSEQHPLTNGLEVFFDVMSKVGLKHEPQIGTESMFKILQGNFRNDVKWKKVSYEINTSNHAKYQPFFIHHSAFDYGFLTPKRRDSLLSNPNSPNKHSSFLFNSPLITNSQQPKKFSTLFSYTINRNFEISIILYPSVMRSAHQIVNLHVRKVKEHQIQNQFRKEQFALMHLEQSFINDKRSEIQEAFLKEQYVKRIIRNSRWNNKSLNNFQEQHLFTIMKSKKYQIHVSLIDPLLKTHQHNLMQKTLKIQAECRSTIRHYCLQLKLGDIFSELKQYYRLYTDARSYSKFRQLLKRILVQEYEVSKSMVVDKVKFYVQKLLLMKKNTYSQFYFVPLANMVSQASVKASSIIQPQKETKSQQKSFLNNFLNNSLLLNSARKNLIFQTLQQLQNSNKQKYKTSLSSLSKITIKNFPIYEIYYKTVKKLLPGHFVIISIYYMPMFDLSQVRVYVNRIRKSFWASVDRESGPNEYERIVDDVVEFVKEKFFSKMIKRETEKLSSKFRECYSQMIKHAETSFLSKSRRTKEIFSGSSNPNSNLSNLTRFRRQRQATHQNTVSANHFSQFTEQLLCKLFHSQRQNKYIIRLSYPATCTYVNPDERKGIDQLINISVLKQNCMLIYKFQTTARKLLSKKLTHKFNVIQLEYQQKNKPFYILFEEIKTLIKSSDETTYGLLNTFRSYFLNYQTNNLVTNSFVSMLSLNILADATSRNLQEFQSRPSNFYYDSPPTNHSKSIRTMFLKDLEGNKYQRYCLFMQNSKILEVLKIRNKFQKKSLTKSYRNIQSEKSNQLHISRQVVRKKNRRQSIEAFLTENSNIQTSINSSLKNTKNSKNNVNKKSLNPDFIVQESYHVNEPFTQQVKSEENFQEKIVYFIDAETEATNEVQSPIEDQGFMINVPFRKYNRKMFKRFFKHLILVRKEKQAHEKQIKQATKDIHLTSLLQIPEANRGSFRSSHISSLQTFQ